MTGGGAATAVADLCVNHGRLRADHRLTMRSRP